MKMYLLVFCISLPTWMIISKFNSETTLMSVFSNWKNRHDLNLKNGGLKDSLKYNSLNVFLTLWSKAKIRLIPCVNLNLRWITINPWSNTFITYIYLTSKSSKKVWIPKNMKKAKKPLSVYPPLPETFFYFNVSRDQITYFNNIIVVKCWID